MKFFYPFFWRIVILGIFINLNSITMTKFLHYCSKTRWQAISSTISVMKPDGPHLSREKLTQQIFCLIFFCKTSFPLIHGWIVILIIKKQATRARKIFEEENALERNDKLGWFFEKTISFGPSLILHLVPKISKEWNFSNNLACYT